jgi:hypothetical protein
MIIEDRRVLVLSGGLFLVLAFVGMILSLMGMSVPDTTGSLKIVEAAVLAPFVLGLFAVCGSFLIHAYRNENYGWLLAFFFVNIFAAYLYGFIVASKPKSNASAA